MMNTSASHSLPPTRFPSRGSDNIFNFYSTTTATTYRFRKPSDELPVLPGIESGFSCNNRRPASIRMNDTADFCTLYKDTYRRIPTVRDIPGAVADDILAKKAHTSFSKQNAFNYVPKTPAPKETEFSSSYPWRSSRSSNVSECLAAPVGTARNGYTRNYHYMHKPEEMNIAPQSEFEDAFKSRGFDGTIPGGNVLEARELSGFAKSCQSQPSTKWDANNSTSYTASFTQPRSRADAVKAPPKPTAVDLDCPSGFVRNFSHGLQHPPADRTATKGGVWMRANQEGNISLHKPYTILQATPPRPDAFSTRNSDVVATPPQRDTFVRVTTPEELNIETKSCHWKPY